MKILNIVVVLLLSLLLFTGCMSREKRFYRDKALEIIKIDLVNTLDDYDSYEPIETTISRLTLDYIGDTLVQNLIKEIRDADSIINLRRDDNEKAYRMVTSCGGYRYFKEEEVDALTPIGH